MAYSKLILFCQEAATYPAADAEADVLTKGRPGVIW
jgi:hypothetical protein